ncbi:7-carboxy-7-deazaguanine synthase QueE, partial [Candidatus Woesearchaeota archaeon]|nr:7-carboxy-7-deazaguanine synthase QueE [Candidatus Woesearchaeota archaeon]
SETFYSVQGEGITQGVPAFFIRLQNCNLNCIWCDTKKIWKCGNEISYKQLEDRIKESGQFNNILLGKVHLIWTGGEPTLQEKEIKGFINYLRKKYGSSKIFSEIETNGTIYVSNDFYENYIDQINCSPKLNNSGMPSQRRINFKSIKQINDNPNSYFKFVICKEKDIIEIENDFIYKFNINKNKIILMPNADNRLDLFKNTQICYELTKKYGYRTITRGQILVWDKKSGV